MKRFIYIFFIFLAVFFLFGCKDNKETKEPTEKTKTAEVTPSNPTVEDNKHTVRFYDFDNNVISEQTVEDGSFATIPTSPSKDGYVFKGWDKDSIYIHSDLDIHPLFERLKFTVNFFDCYMSLLSSEKVFYGESATAPKTPGVEGYVFKGWDKDYTNVTSNLEVYGQYERLSYEVKVYDDDNHLLETLNVLYGDTASPTKVVTKVGYAFTGWDHELTNVHSNMEIRPLFQIEEYTITYYDGNKKLNLEPSTFTVLDFIDLPLPTKDGYEFLGWYQSQTGTIKTVTITCETGDRVFYARWEEIEEETQLSIPSDCKFTVTTIKKIPHSSNPNLMVYQPDLTTATMTLPSTSVTQWDWTSLDTSIATISQWSSISSVSSGYCLLKMTYKSDSSIVGYIVIHCTADGIFGATIEEANQKITYTVTFLDADGNKIDEQTVNAGEAAIVPTVPTIENKTFVGWDGDIYNITADTTLKAQYIDGKPYFENKTVSILGDSISTYRGIIPDGWSYFYPYPTADLGDYNQTWWMVMTNTLGMKLLRNNSWSGSCVSSGTGTSSCTNDSRLIELLDGDTRPDVIVINMGANDCASRYVELSTFDSSFKIMIDKIKALCPDSEIYLCLLPYSKMYDASARNQYNAVIEKYANTYGCKLIDLGNAYSDPSSYLVDSGHPNKTGMELLGKACVTDMLASIDVTYTK